MILKETLGIKDGIVNLLGIFRIRNSLPGMEKHLTDDGPLPMRNRRVACGA